MPYCIRNTAAVLSGGEMAPSHSECAECDGTPGFVGNVRERQGKKDRSKRKLIHIDCSTTCPSSTRADRRRDRHHPSDPGTSQRHNRTSRQSSQHRFRRTVRRLPIRRPLSPAKPESTTLRTNAGPSLVARTISTVRPHTNSPARPRHSRSTYPSCRQTSHARRDN